MPTSITPIASSGGSLKAKESKNASKGIIVNCAIAPIAISFGLVNNTLKSSSFNVIPIQNIAVIRR